MCFLESHGQRTVKISKEKKNIQFVNWICEASTAGRGREDKASWKAVSLWRLEHIGWTQNMSRCDISFWTFSGLEPDRSTLRCCISSWCNLASPDIIDIFFGYHSKPRWLFASKRWPFTWPEAKFMKLQRKTQVIPHNFDKSVKLWIQNWCFCVASKKKTFFEKCQVQDYIFMTNEKVLLDAGELWSVMSSCLVWHSGASVRFLAPREPKGSSNIGCATQEGLGNSKHETWQLPGESVHKVCGVTRKLKKNKRKPLRPRILLATWRNFWNWDQDDAFPCAEFRAWLLNKLEAVLFFEILQCL